MQITREPGSILQLSGAKVGRPWQSSLVASSDLASLRPSLLVFAGLVTAGRLRKVLITSRTSVYSGLTPVTNVNTNNPALYWIWREEKIAKQRPDISLSFVYFVRCWHYHQGY